MWTLLDAQQQIASEMDQSPNAPTEGGTDWNIRKNALNRSLFDWENSNEWESLKVVFNSKVTTAGFATLGLPANFKKLDSAPRIMWDGRSAVDFPAIDPSRNNLYNDSDLYVN